MPRSAVLTGRYFRHFSETGQGLFDGLNSVKWPNSTQAESGQIGDRESSKRTKMPQRITAHVTIRTRVRLLADSYAV